MNKAKIKEGVTRIVGAIYHGLIVPPLLLVAALLIFAALGAVVYSILTTEKFTAILAVVVKLVVAALDSISLTQWILIVLVWIAWDIGASNRKILAKLEDIQSELSHDDEISNS
jgi:hypothetical protein